MHTHSNLPAKIAAFLGFMALFAGLFGGTPAAVPVQAQVQPTATVAELTIDFDSVSVAPEELRQPIREALTATAGTLPATALTLTALRLREPQGDWTYAVVLPSEFLGERVEETSAASYLALLGRRDTKGAWRFAVQGSAEFVDLASAAPPDFIEFGPETLPPAGVDLNQAITMSYLFPWTAGQRWYKTQGWHGGAPWSNALDLQPSARGYNLDISREFAVLAAERGRLEVNCNDGVTISLAVIHPNGQGTLYVHLDARTYRTDLVGKQINRGQYIGHLYRTGNTNNGVGGAYSTRCGYGTAAHLHFALPTRTMSINGYSAESVASSAFATLYSSSNQRIDNPAAVSPCDSPNMLYCAEYYSNRWLSGSPAFKQYESRINRPWGWGGPGNGVGVDNFSVRWKGRRYFPTAGWWNFWLGADDGVRMWIDGQLVIDNWVDTSYAVRYHRRQLSAGYHEVKVEYYENGGVAGAHLCAAPHGQFCAEYYNNAILADLPTFAAWESAVNKDWGAGGPGNGVGADNFSVRWRGRHYFNGATHTFRACADDGIRVFIDGVLIINQWRLQSYTCVNKSYTLPAGWRDVRVEYFEQGGSAAARVAWWPTSTLLVSLPEDDAPPPNATVTPTPAARYQVFLPQLFGNTGAAPPEPDDEEATGAELMDRAPTTEPAPAEGDMEELPMPDATPVQEP